MKNQNTETVMMVAYMGLTLMNTLLYVRSMDKFIQIKAMTPIQPVLKYLLEEGQAMSDVRIRRRCKRGFNPFAFDRAIVLHASSTLYGLNETEGAVVFAKSCSPLYFDLIGTREGAVQCQKYEKRLTTAYEWIITKKKRFQGPQGTEEASQGGQ